MVYLLLASKNFQRNLQYRAAHMINNAASALFGFVYIAIWRAVSPSGTGDYGGASLTHYIAFCQALLWISTFFPAGLSIGESVRTGAVAVELMRPISFQGYILAREAGGVFYNLLYRSVPLLAVFAVTVGLHKPGAFSSYILTILAAFLASYVGLTLNYLVGLASFWTTEVRWAHSLLYSLTFGLAGYLVPLDLMPRPIGSLARFLPFAAQNFYPARVYLGLDGIEGLLWPTFWALALTVIAHLITRQARRRMEVQGG